ncbi:OmpA family protein [Vibrio mediterranei]|uniref:OmpA family protein n=1 Tax=Vibrio mediterranei TaxID=689 RepID=A0A3G4VJU7_9VIBR|nr:OmpA family protein [Vibrio mediterranei]AYV25083.1 OmpA family protein [Vibrio mediterranei]MCG9790500.1 OmpA family protein [Vibrio mediterranei]
MKKPNKTSFALVVMSILCACSNQIRDDNLILDYDWKPDVYNLVIFNVADADNMRFWVRRTPEFAEGSPHLRACVEVAQPTEPNRFYIANLNTYSLIEIKSCSEDYLVVDNLIEPEISKAFDGEQWRTVYGISKSELNHSSLLLKFESLFLVNEFSLTKKARNSLIAVLKELQKWPVQNVIIYGVADSSGTHSTNRILAEQRAKVTREFLIEEGLKNVPVHTRGSVENALGTAKQRVGQRRFMIEVKLKKHGR